jgi:TctA family transporter
MLLAFILGPMMEDFLRRALLLSRGSPLILITSPISGVMLTLAVVSLVLVLLPAFRKTREVAFQEET